MGVDRLQCLVHVHHVQVQLVLPLLDEVIRMSWTKIPSIANPSLMAGLACMNDCPIAVPMKEAIGIRTDEEAFMDFQQPTSTFLHEKASQQLIDMFQG